MDNRRFVTKHTNPLGETRWQPTLPNGVRGWVPEVRVHPWETKWDTAKAAERRPIKGPRLYRSRARAIRVARRKWVRTTENQWEATDEKDNP